MPPTASHNPTKPLGAGVFWHMAELGPEALSSLVDTLVKHGDIASLRAGLDGDALREMDADTAVAHCTNVLLAFSARANSPECTDKGAEELRLVQEWVKQRSETDGAHFIENIALRMKSRTSQTYFATVLEMLIRPPFNLDVLSDLRLTPEQAMQPGDAKQPYSPLGHVADSYSVTALSLVGPAAARFPDTTAVPPVETGGRWVTLNLVEQTAFLNNTDCDVLEKMVAVTKPGSLAQDQLGDLVFMLLVNQDDDFINQKPESIRRFADKIERIKDDRSASVRIALTLIGMGAQFPDPEAAWGYVRGAKSYVPLEFAYDKCDIEDPLPLAHAVLYLNPYMCPRATGARALSRMITEGGVPIDLVDCRGRTFLQAAAAHGHQEAVETLLSLGADPKVTGKRAGRKSAAAIADANGHSVVAQMIRAHQAQGAIASALARHQTSTRPS